jgi:hypothetical protein
MDLWFPMRVIARLDIEREITGGYGGPRQGYVPSPIPEDITRLVFGIDDNGGHLQRLSVNETLVRLVRRQPEGGVGPRR